MVQIKRKARAAEDSAEAGSAFVELMSSELSDEARSSIELVLRSGHRLRLSGAFDVEQVLRLATALESC